MSFLLNSVILGTIAIFTLSVIAVILYNSKKEIPKDRVEVVNFMRQYTKDGFAKGYQTNRINGEKRTIIEYLPTDVDYDKTQKISLQKVVVDNDKIITMMKGTLSNNESQIWLLPPKAEDLPKGLKDSKFGSKIMKMIEDINNSTEERDIIRSAMETQSLLLNNTKGGKLVREHLKYDSALLKDTKKKMMDEKQNTNTGFNSSRN